MNESLMSCRTADEGDIREAAAFDLARKRYPSSAALRAKAMRDSRKECRRVVPEILDWLAEHGSPDADPHETAKACTSAVVGTLGAWLLAAIIEQIVLMVIRWYFTPASAAWRQKVQAQGRSHNQ